MKTEDLIERLGSELRPVQRLASPGRRASLWLACAVSYVTIAVLQAWIRHGAVGAIADLPYVIEQITLAVVGVAAARAAFVSVVPGQRTSGAVAVMKVAATLMMVALGWGLFRDMNTAGTLGIGRETDWPCVISISLGSVGLWLLAVGMLRRGAPLTPVSTSVLAAVAALSLANIEACISRSHAFTATVIIWHGATVVVALGSFAALARRVLPFRWPQRHPG